MERTPHPDAPGSIAAAVRDARVAAAFDAVVVCSGDGEVIDVNPAGAELVPDGDRARRWLIELISSAPGSAGDPAADVHAESPNAEGIMWREEHEGASVVVLHLRDPANAPAAADLRRQLHRFERVLATGPMFVHIYDRELNSRWSTSWLRSEMGYDLAPALTGEENLALVHPDDVAAAQRGLERVLQGAEHEQIRIRVRHADGGWRWLAVMHTALLEDDEVGYVLAHAWDVTDQVTAEMDLEASNGLLEQLIDALEKAVVVIAGGVIRFANASFAELFSVTGEPGDLIGRSVEDLRPRAAAVMSDPDFFEQVRRDMASGHPVDGRIAQTVAGRTLEGRMLSVDPPGREGSRVWILRDITAQRLAEGRRERLLELERVARRGAEEQNRHLRELDELKNELVATVTHELRTPISAIRSYVELLAEDDSLQEESRDLARSAARGIARLGRLVDDLLVLAQLEARTLPLQSAEVDVTASIEGVIADLRSSQTGSVVISEDLTPGVPWLGDRLRLEQIITNLLGNALKFASTTVACSASVAGGEWVIEVGDDGPGIPGAEAGLIFEPFVRGRSATRRGTTGAGLGLPLSRRLAEHLGGSLAIEPAPRHQRELTGAWFRLSLPVAGAGPVIG